MDPWQAPYQNSNDYRCFTYGQKCSSSNFLPTSLLFQHSATPKDLTQKENLRHTSGAASTPQ